MIVIFCLVAGLITGLLRARRRGGRGFDLAQYAAVHAILFAIIGLFLTLIIDRMV